MIRFPAVAAPILLVAVSAFAQGWPDIPDPAWTPPILEDLARAEYPEEARRAGLYGVVFVRVLVSEDGYVGRAELVHADHPELAGPAYRAARACRFFPAAEFDQPRRAWAVVGYFFGAGDDIRPAVLIDAPAPALDDSVPGATSGASVRVTVKVDELGCVYAVTRAWSRWPRLTAAVRRAATGCLFTPAVHNGEPVAGRQELVYIFGPEGVEVAMADDLAADDELPLLSGSEAPEALLLVDPGLPANARGGRLEGLVLIRALVDSTGAVERAEIEEGAVPELDEAALTAVLASRFRWRDGPRRAWVVVPYRFGRE